MTRPTMALLGLLCCGLVAGAAALTYSAYRAISTNAGNSYAAGSVTLSDNDSGTAMFTTLSGIKPGDSETSCIQVRDDGTLSSTVRLYASVTGTLAPYVTLTATRGTDPSPVFDTCTTFLPDPTNYVGAGLGVIYSGALSSFPTTYPGGIVDPTVGGGTETWTQNEVHVYKFVLTQADNNSAQGLSSTVGFTWEARNQ
jgi:hypothetical protein